MNTLQNIQQWSVTHHPRWLVVLRVALGLCLFIKGIGFINHEALLEQSMANGPLARDANWLPLVICCVHLLGGFLLIVGLLTRWAALLQLPILVGAVIFVNAHRGFASPEPEFLLSLVVLLLLAFFLLEGGGPVSLDHYFRRNPTPK
jgi:putative oxidoreductase